MPARLAAPIYIYIVDSRQSHVRSYADVPALGEEKPAKTVEKREQERLKKFMCCQKTIASLSHL